VFSGIESLHCPKAYAPVPVVRNQSAIADLHDWAANLEGKTITEQDRRLESARWSSTYSGLDAENSEIRG